MLFTALFLCLITMIGNVVELADILDIPVITIGKFQGQKGPPVLLNNESAIDQMIRGSNQLQPIIREAGFTGSYRGNDDIKISGEIPGILNFNHQGVFPDAPGLNQVVNETLKDAIQNASVSFFKKFIPDDNGNLRPWMVERLSNLPPDIAVTLAKKFPYRSLDLLPMTNPDTGEEFPWVAISTAFLDRLTPPAVKGQDASLKVELAEENEPYTRIISNEPILTQGVEIMADNIEEKVNVAELQALRATLTDQTEMITELQAKFAEEKAAREKAVELAIASNTEKDTQITELQAAQDKTESKDILAELSALRTVGELSYLPSPAFLDIIKPPIENNGVVELQDGENAKKGLARVFQQVLELASKGKILVSMTNQGAMSYPEPGTDEDKSDDEKIAELQKEEPELSKTDAFIRVLDKRFGKGAK